MALCARHSTGLLPLQQQQRPLPCRGGSHCSTAACSSGSGTSSSFSSPGPVLCSGGRSGCGGAFAQQVQPGRRALQYQRRCQRQVLCSAAGGDNSSDNASRVFAWAMDAARRTFRMKVGDAQQQQQQPQPSGGPQQSEGADHQDQPEQEQQQQRLGSGAAEASLATQPDSTQQRDRRTNSGSSAHDVADDHRQESFDCWKKYIEEMDEKIKASMEFDELLGQAVAEERYGDAARLRKQLEELIQDDTVGSATEEMEKALQEERYEDAARLRDESYTGLVGWWAGHGEDDPYGHLLHISAGYSSYTGRAYLPRQLFEIREYVNSGQLSEDDMDMVLLNMGQPFMEVFLRKDADTGRLRSCATAILPSEDTEADSQDPQNPQSVVSVDGSDEDDSVVQVNVQISSGVTLDPEGLSDRSSISDSNESMMPREVSEVLENLKDEVLRQLKASMEQQDGKGGERDAFADIIDPAALLGAAGAAGADLGSGIGGGLGGIIEQLGGGGTFEMGGDDGTTITVEVTQAGGSGPQEFSRHAADLRRFGKDRFVIQTLKDRDVDPQDPEGSEDGGSEVDELEAKVLADLTEANGEPADVSRRLTGLATKPEQQTGGRRRPRLASDIRRQGRQGRLSLIQIADFDSSKPEDAQPEALKVRDLVAREVRRLQQAHREGAGPAVDRATIISLIRKVAKEQRTARRQAAAAADGHPAGGLATIDPAELFKSRVSYRRIPTGLPYTDPFSGTYLAAFGPHGVEMLLLTRAVGKGGHEIVTARKLTGDPNVPAGQISFTANIDRSARLDPSEYPEILGVTGRYAGKGLVAQPGFTEPRWVEGELLQFAEGSPVTQGARLGFMWACPGQRRFLVLLHRVGLDEEDT